MQEIITFFIVFGAGFYAFFHGIKMFLPSKNKSKTCGCSGNCSLKNNYEFKNIRTSALKFKN